MTPFLAYVLAEQVHGSGVTAVVVASVTLGALRPKLTSPRIRLQLAAVYPTVIFSVDWPPRNTTWTELPIERLAGSR